MREEDPTRPPGVDPRLTTGIDFEAFFDLHFDRVFRAVLLIAGDRIEAEDVAQEAFVKVYERWDRVALMDDPVGYLYRTALNERRSRARRAIRWRRRSLFERAPDDQTSASAIARAEVMRALAGLTEEQRAVVALVEYVGMEPSEAASVLGISAEAARARLHRAREAMRQELQDDA